MSIYDKASVVTVPSAYKTSVLYSVVPTNGDADLTYSRAGDPTATRINKDGLVELVSTNNPRINYTDGEGALLFEPFTINELSYSEDFSQWNDTNVTVTDNFITSPDGALTAAKLDFNGTAGANISSLTTATGTTTFSVWLRVPSGTQTVTIGVSATDTSDVTVTETWTRFEHSGTGAVGYVECDDDVDVYVWGAQLEEKSFKTSYIKTTGTSRNRGAETAFKRDAEALLNSEEGVLFADMRTIAQTGTERYISIDDTTFNNYVRFGYHSTNNVIRAEVKVGGVTEVLLDYTSSQVTSFKKVAFKYKENDFALWIDGTEVLTAASGSTFSADTLNDIELESLGSSFFNGEIKTFAIFTEALSDDELTTLTS